MCSLRLRQNDTRILSQTLKEVHFATVFASNCHVRSTTLVPTQTITWNSAIKLLSDWDKSRHHDPYKYLLNCEMEPKKEYSKNAPRRQETN